MKKSNFLAHANYTLKNKKWLRYSSNIARRILAALEDTTEIDRNVLAEKLEVSKQYISKLVKGQENLSLQTIAKISDALGVELITFPPYKYSYNKQAAYSASDYSHNDINSMVNSIGTSDNFNHNKTEKTVQRNEGVIIPISQLKEKYSQQPSRA